MSSSSKSRFTFIVITCSSLFVFCSCNSFDKASREIYKETKKENKDVFYDATETNDSTHSFFIIFKHSRFAYFTGPINEKGRKQKYYTGTYTERNDTIFLSYYKGYQPLDLSNFLIKDSSGDYLIFPFKDPEREIYLKIRKTAAKKNY